MGSTDHILGYSEESKLRRQEGTIGHLQEQLGEATAIIESLVRALQASAMGENPDTGYITRKAKEFLDGEQ